MDTNSPRKADVSNLELMSDNPAINVIGVGLLDQYGSYASTFWEKGVAYFLRDQYIREIERLSALDRVKEARAVVAKLDRLNSDIAVREYGV